MEQTAQALSGASGRLIPMAADVSKPGDIAASVERVLTETGCVDVLVNNAGINMAKRILELDIGDWGGVKIRGGYVNRGGRGGGGGGGGGLGSEVGAPGGVELGVTTRVPALGGGTTGLRTLSRTTRSSAHSMSS